MSSMDDDEEAVYFLPKAIVDDILPPKTQAPKRYTNCVERSRKPLMGHAHSHRDSWCVSPFGIADSTIASPYGADSTFPFGGYRDVRGIKSPCRSNTNTIDFITYEQRLSSRSVGGSMGPSSLAQKEYSHHCRERVEGTQAGRFKPIKDMQNKCVHNNQIAYRENWPQNCIGQTNSAITAVDHVQSQCPHMAHPCYSHLHEKKTLTNLTTCDAAHLGSISPVNARQDRTNPRSYIVGAEASDLVRHTDISHEYTPNATNLYGPSLEAYVPTSVNQYLLETNNQNSAGGVRNQLERTEIYFAKHNTSRPELRTPPSLKHMVSGSDVDTAKKGLINCHTSVPALLHKEYGQVKISKAVAKSSVAARQFYREKVRVASNAPKTSYAVRSNNDESGSSAQWTKKKSMDESPDKSSRRIIPRSANISPIKQGKVWKAKTRMKTEPISPSGTITDRKSVGRHVEYRPQDSNDSEQHTVTSDDQLIVSPIHKSARSPLCTGSEALPSTIDSLDSVTNGCSNIEDKQCWQRSVTRRTMRKKCSELLHRLWDHTLLYIFGLSDWRMLSDHARNSVSKDSLPNVYAKARAICIRVFAHIVQIHNTALCLVVTHRYIGFCFLFLYTFPLMVQYLLPWAPPWAPICLWYAFLIQLLCTSGRRTVVTTFRVILPLVFVIEGISSHSFLLDLSASELLLVGFILSILKACKPFSIVLFISFGLQSLLAIFLGSYHIVQWIQMVMALYSLSVFGLYEIHSEESQEQRSSINTPPNNHASVESLGSREQSVKKYKESGRRSQYNKARKLRREAPVHGVIYLQ